MIAGGGKDWFDAQELADLGLPGLSKVKRKVNERAAHECWALKHGADGSPLARPRRGRGGGLEYHITLLPASARAELIKRGMVGGADVATQLRPADALADNGRWGWFSAQSEKVRAEAMRRAAILNTVEALEDGGQTATSAVALAADQHKVSAATIWNWRRMVDGIAPANRLPFLAPRRGGGGAEAEVADWAWQVIKSDYLRPEQPTWASCYARLELIAAARGETLPHVRTLWRKLSRDVDPRLVIAMREGADALRRTLPPQQRTVAGMHAMELVNVDGHTWDVFVKWPDGTIARPCMVAIQDVYSRRFLTHSTGRVESAVETRLAFARLFQRYGIPPACLMDNGRAFASKWVTGGSKTRYRFKVRDEEPQGLLTAFGIVNHWAKPYRGQSKPIERMFRDFCDHLAKHPAFSGAYTGNTPLAKPENYRSTAVPLDLFLKVVEAGFAAHNARKGRRTEMGAGVRSLDEVFAESYAVAPIGKATPDQLRLALLTAEDRPTDRKSGAVTLYGNRYWSEELSLVAGDRVTVRCDPDDLHAPIHVYTRDGHYICSAPVIEATGFLDVEAAKVRGKLEGNLRKAIKVQREAEQLLDAAQIAALLPAMPDDDLPETGVVRPVRLGGQTAAALRPVQQRAQRAEREAVETAVIDRMAVGLTRLRSVK